MSSRVKVLKHCRRILTPIVNVGRIVPGWWGPSPQILTGGTPPTQKDLQVVMRRMGAVCLVKKKQTEDGLRTILRQNLLEGGSTAQNPQKKAP